ncbi:Eukaryotic translation initiation factor 3 subunit C [Sciurus carolinensis]|uniref:Eukaryotic translation initiation factor 3 subunit C n=1 Tax=Sciurus carolinensis TaxID=30640 RepID=A0AA41N9I0_SCICA|nr:Eukaryotic translation initiation factor 3 subunit C [Sciurus carolinensis]
MPIQPTDHREWNERMHSLWIMAAHENDAHRRVISKQLLHQLQVGKQQSMLGPAESMREHVVAASKAMKLGDWKTCHSFIINEKMNGILWDLFPEADKVRKKLVRKIQEESLKTYIFTYSSVYNSISMETLSDMFELDLPTVHSIISKMIISEEVLTSIDQPTDRGDAPHLARCPAEPGSAAGQETGQPGGE